MMQAADGTWGRGEQARSGLFAGGRAVPLTSVEIDADVVAGHARVRVRQRYRLAAEEARPVEAVYTFPLPTRAVVVGFAMTVEGRRLEGEVHEREEAFARYDEALTQGHGAALLEQERPNVFTANVGNLLPGEETTIELTLVEPLEVEEGAVRYAIPTLVAPRYIPGSPSGDRTGHGVADPTTRVPDADRISPRTGAPGEVTYGLALAVTFDLGFEVDVESPSHDVRVRRDEAGRARVSFERGEVALDRDVILVASPRQSDVADAAVAGASIVSVRTGEDGGVLALTVVPDLEGRFAASSAGRQVVFVLDRSGSMDGVSMQQAKTALRLCLRQLREGDTFAVLAFDDRLEAMSRELVPFTPRTLQEADRWLEGIDARGGTELLEPLVRARKLAPGGVVVLLTDGQVGNEQEIERAIVALPGDGRIYPFGIGTNVSDALLVALAERTGGAATSIFPGERIDDKVVAQFARATAPRVVDLEVRFRGVEVAEIAPARPVALVDGEPLSMFARFEGASAQSGVAEVRGRYAGGGDRFVLEVPFEVPVEGPAAAAGDPRAPIVGLWAQARIRDLERSELPDRRAKAMKTRIVELAKRYGVSSKYTSFVVVEKRTGDRRVSEQAETRAVPVHAPAGWASRPVPMASFASSSSVPVCAVPVGAAAPPALAPKRARGIGARLLDSLGFGGGGPSKRPQGNASVSSGPPRPPSTRSAAAPPPPPRAEASFAPEDGALDDAFDGSSGSPALDGTSGSPALDGTSGSPALAILGRQAASGLWEAPPRDVIEVTVEAMLELVRAGISSAHPVYGAQTQKAVEALLRAVRGAPSDARPELLELAVALAWLLAQGRRTRAVVRDVAASRAPSLSPILGRDADVRARVTTLSPA